MVIKISDIKALIEEYEHSRSSKPLLSRLFATKNNFIEQLKEFFKKYADKEDLNVTQRVELIELLAKNSAKREDNQDAAKVFNYFLAAFGLEIDPLRVDLYQKNLSLLAESLALLSKSNLLTEPVFTWALSLLASDILCLRDLLTLLNANNFLNISYFPLFINNGPLLNWYCLPSPFARLDCYYLPDPFACELLMGTYSDSEQERKLGNILLTLVKVINQQSLWDNIEALDKLRAYYMDDQQTLKIPRLSVARRWDKRSDDIIRFFDQLIKQQLLTPEGLDAILSAPRQYRTRYADSRTYGVEDTPEQIEIKAHCTLLEELAALAEIYQYFSTGRTDNNKHAIIRQNFSVLIKLLTSKQLRKFDYWRGDGLYLPMLKDYSCEMESYTDIFELCSGLVLLKYRGILTKENVKFVTEQQDLCLTHHLPEDKQFFNRTIITQEPSRIVQFDALGNKKILFGEGPSFKDFINTPREQDPLIYHAFRLQQDNYFNLPLEENEVRSIKIALRNDNLINALNETLEEQGGIPCLAAAHSFAVLLVLLEDANMNTVENRRIIQQANHRQLDRVIAVFYGRGLSAFFEPQFTYRERLRLVANFREFPDIPGILPGILLNYQMLFVTLRTFRNIPQHLWTRAVVDQIFERCRQANGDAEQARTAISLYVTQLIAINLHQAQAPAVAVAINYSQSTHDEKVHETVSESVLRLYNHAPYRAQMNTPAKLNILIDGIKEWVSTLPELGTGELDLPEMQLAHSEQMLIQRVPYKYKIMAAKRSVLGPQDVLNNASFIDEASGLSMQQMYALYWLAAHDLALINEGKEERKETLISKEDVESFYIDALYQSQRAYRFLNIPEGSEIFYEIGGGDMPSCTGGRFNKPAEVFSSVHPDVSIAISSVRLLDLQFPVVVRTIASTYLNEKKAEQATPDFITYLDNIIQETNVVFWDAIRSRVEAAIVEKLGESVAVKRKLAAIIDTGEYVDISELATAMKAAVQQNMAEFGAAAGGASASLLQFSVFAQSSSGPSAALSAVTVTCPDEADKGEASEPISLLNTTN